MFAKNLIPVGLSPARTPRARTLLTVGLTAGPLRLRVRPADSPKGGGNDRIEGQSEFQSIAPLRRRARSAAARQTALAAAVEAATARSPRPPTAAGTASTPRRVEETDLYRLEGDRLYYLNGYRGLMVFDVSNADQPKPPRPVPDLRHARRG